MTLRASKQLAFTLIELLVVIAIIGILVSLLLPALSGAKDKGRQAACRNNLKQMAIAFTLYHGDNSGAFPAPGSRLTYGVQAEDWIWWQYGRDITNSAIARYLDGSAAKTFTCPSDSDAKKLQSEGFILSDPYRFSYALTSYNLTNTSIATGQTNWFNRGMATIITRSGEVYRFNAQQIKRPAAKIMLVEEDRGTIDDPRWIPYGKTPSLISERHGKKGNVLFADSHVESVIQGFGRDPINSEPSL